jgi:hypothetical protein
MESMSSRCFCVTGRSSPGYGVRRRNSGIHILIPEKAVCLKPRPTVLIHVPAGPCLQILTAQPLATYCGRWILLCRRLFFSKKIYSKIVQCSGMQDVMPSSARRAHAMHGGLQNWPPKCKQEYSDSLQSGQQWQQPCTARDIWSKIHRRSESSVVKRKLRGQIKNPSSCDG